MNGFEGQLRRGVTIDYKATKSKTGARSSNENNKMEIEDAFDLVPTMTTTIRKSVSYRPSKMFQDMSVQKESSSSLTDSSSENDIRDLKEITEEHEPDDS